MTHVIIKIAESTYHRLSNAMKPISKRIFTTLFSAIALVPCLANADIYISEVVEGSSNNKAIEISNNSNAAVTLTGFELASEFNGWNNQYDLSGVTIQANDVWVIANSSADAQLLAKADVTSSSFLVRFSGNDALALLLNGAEHDVFGAFGFDNFNQNVTLRRCNHDLTTTYQPWQWAEYPQDAIDNLGVFSAEDPLCVPPPVPELPTAFTVKTIMELQGSGTSSPFIDAENDVYTSEQVFSVTGVVTAIQSTGIGNDLPQGFFIQDAVGDSDASTSDGIFVKANILALTSNSASTQESIAIGDELTVYGVVTESYGWTIFEATVSNTFELIYRQSTGNVIAATPLRKLETDATFDTTLERHESMHVLLDLDAKMQIARTFGFDFGSFRNNLVITNGGVNFHPNQHAAPGSQVSIDNRANNEANRITVETFAKASNGTVPWFPDFGDDNGQGATDDYLRVGATISGLEGVITYSSSEFRLFTTNTITNADLSYQLIADRTPAPVIADGNLKIATMNVLNLFNSPFGGAKNPLETNRGAEDEDEFIVQRAKIVAAIAALDADVIGIMEVENNGFDDDSSIVQLVNLVNAEFSPENQYVIARPTKDKRIGTDAISSQLIYRRSVIALDRLDIIEMPYQRVPGEFFPTQFEGDWEDFRPTSKYMRNAVTPVFTLDKPNEKKLTVSVNHFKSKGSTCWEDLQKTKVNDEGLTVHYLEDTDFQGSCEHLRVAAANYIGNQLEDYQGYRIIVGDLNSYANEDPVMVLTNQANLPSTRSIKAGRNVFVGSKEIFGNENEVIKNSFGYINIIQKKHEDTVSYSFNDEVGTLDYVLITPDVEQFVVDATDWNINSVESTLLQYESSFTGSLEKYNDPFRSSDHDPAVVSLNMLPMEATVTDEVQLPSTPINMPSSSKLKVDEGYKAVVDLTEFSVISMKVGERINIVISDKNSNGVVTGSQLGRITLTQSDIAKGWVTHSFQQVVEGDFVAEGFYKDELVIIAQGFVNEAEKTKGGSLSILTFLLLFSVMIIVRKSSLKNIKKENI